MSMIQVIRERLVEQSVSFNANDNIWLELDKSDMREIERATEGACHALLRALMIDTEHDPNTKGTARRMARMLVREVLRGRYESPPDVTCFPNERGLDEVYTLGPVSVRSVCSHHFVPIIGKVWVGVIPGERVIGISKFARLVDWYMARAHIQEDATVAMADMLEDRINPKALAVVMRAEHLCMTWRGVRETGTTMTTSVMRGAFLDKPEARAEFFSIIKGQGY